MAEIGLWPSGEPIGVEHRWQAWHAPELLTAAEARCLPILLRTEANDLRPGHGCELPHRLIVPRQRHCALGKANARFYRRNGAQQTVSVGPYLVITSSLPERPRQSPHSEK